MLDTTKEIRSTPKQDIQYSANRCSDGLLLLYLHWAVTKKVEIHVLPKKITLWMRGVKLLSSHEKVAGKIVSLGKENSN